MLMTHSFTLSKIVSKSKRRVGRGHGSGRVKTSGRGTKGQKARGKIRLGFEGGQLELAKRLPFRRGKNRNKSRNAYVFPVQLKVLAKLPSGADVTVEVLQKHNLLTLDATRAKVLDDGSMVNKKYSVKIPCSKSVKAKIEKAGGRVTLDTDTINTVS